MANNSKISKMFGALVLSGCIHQGTPANASDATKQPTTNSNAKTEKQPENAPVAAAPEPQPSAAPESQPSAESDHCQLEFSLNQYKRFNLPDAKPGDEVEKTRTCLDNKTDQEILKIINDAKTKTCESPFCGCWLG